MFWSIMKCNDLKIKYEREQGFKYDAVIRTRFDLELELEQKMSEFDLESFYVKSHCHSPLSRQDVFAFSNSKNMDWYSNTYVQIPVLMANGVEFCPEILLGTHLALSNKVIRKVPGGYRVVR